MAGEGELRERRRQDSVRLEAAQRELDEQTFEGRSDDERVTVTVSSAGRLQDLDLDPRVFRTPVDANGVAEAVKLAYARACDAASARANELLQPILGPGFDAAAPPRSGEDEAAQILQVGRRLRERNGDDL